MRLLPFINILLLVRSSNVSKNKKNEYVAIHKSNDTIDTNIDIVKDENVLKEAENVSRENSDDKKEGGILNCLYRYFEDEILWFRCMGEYFYSFFR
ncbi:putative SP-containing protein [Vairimorpha necatrix]|uniref:SP-containing protein n=1 Tax=Vairimorpha necatrix TaxID=6039 RepID=A0AAX4JGR6_9MICR